MKHQYLGMFISLGLGEALSPAGSPLPAAPRKSVHHGIIQSYITPPHFRLTGLPNPVMRRPVPGDEVYLATSLSQRVRWVLS